jgi:chromate transporter
LVASLGFTLPSMLAMIAFGDGILSLGGDPGQADWLHALMVIAAAVVAQAVWSMARALCPDRRRGTIALATAALLVVWPGATARLLAILAGGLIGWRWCKTETSPGRDALALPLSRPVGALMLVAFCVLLALILLTVTLYRLHH